jgi:amino acid adenylation domain-containing protein
MTWLPEQVRYWRNQLADAPAAMELPADRPRPTVNSYRAGTVAFDIPAGVTGGLRALGRDRDATLFTVLLAGFQVVLARHASTADVLVGVPVAGPAAPGTRPASFTNTLVMRTDCSGDPRFVDLLDRVRATVAGAFAHQDLRFEQLLEELTPPVDLSRNPVVQVMFGVAGEPGRLLDLPGLTAEPFSAGTETTRYDLSVSMSETDGGLAGRASYSTELFDRPTIARLTDGFARVLAAVAARPQRRLSALPVLGEPECLRLTREWNDTAMSSPDPVTVPRLFAAQVARVPDAVAVAAGGRRLTYRELDEQSRRLARELRRAGAGPGQVVGLSAPRNADAIIGLLGILRSGAAYLPLDPGYPAERLAFMLADSEVSVIVAGADAPPSPRSGIAVITVADQSRPDTDHPNAEPADAAAPGDLAYVIYTSGSTGLPKGVEVTHANLTAVLARLQRYCGSQVLLMASLSFDASWRALGILLTGGCLHILDHRCGPDMIRAYLLEHGVDTVSCTPSQLIPLVTDQSWPRPLRVLAGGEVFPATLWDEVASRPDIEAFNLYGPTECTVDATAAPVRGRRPVIGRPIGGTRLYVLDQDQALAPIGAVGELYIGGSGVARGYHGRPELTAERFVPDPFADHGKRLYRTGDLVRYSPSGDLEFVGRIDAQLKIRGIRVEPGEIEAALLRHPGVAEAVVVGHEDKLGSIRLVAYVIPARGQAASTADLREHLSGLLPGFMVPSTVIPLEKMPVSANGKLDRRALPAPDGARPKLAERYLAPRTRTEGIIAEIWTDLLDVSPVGVLDSFFDLGGHSLLAIQVISRIDEAFGIELALPDLFETPVIAPLAEKVEKLLSSAGQESAAPDAGPVPA